jgi:Transcriptional Coactivator p15 (PC4)
VTDADEAGGPAGRVYGEIEKNKAEVVRVQLQEDKGRRYVDVRTYSWAEDGPKEALRPSRKGVSLRLEQRGELRAALDALATDVAAAAAPERPAGAVAAPRGGA